MKPPKSIPAEFNFSIKLDWRDLYEAMVALYLFLQSSDESQMSFDITEYALNCSYRPNSCKQSYTQILYMRCVSTHNFLAHTRSNANLDALGGFVTLMPASGQCAKL